MPNNDDDVDVHLSNFALLTKKQEVAKSSSIGVWANLPEKYFDSARINANLT